MIKPNQRVLLLRLRIKRDTKRIDESVRENFGYCPDYKWFDDLIYDRTKDQDELELITQ